MRRAPLPARILTPVGARVRLQTGAGDLILADILFLALGLGAFALFGLYAALLRKV